MAAGTMQTTRVEIELQRALPHQKEQALAPALASDAVGAARARRTARFATPIARAALLEGVFLVLGSRQRAETRIDVYEAGRATKEHGPAGDSRSTCHLETIQE